MPIRRYSHSTCHRALLRELGLSDESMPDDLPGLAEHLSAREREVADLEHTAEDTEADSALGAWPPCHPAKLGWERNQHPATPAAGSPATLPVRPAGAPCEAHARASNRGARPRPCTGGALAADVGCAPSLTHHKCSSARVVVGELTRVSASLAGLWSPEFA
jgi:hypothetical protein